MHSQTLVQLRHSHRFHLDSSDGERRTRQVVWLTAVMMVVEIAAGYGFGSMALLADGWHMGTHVAALSISLIAYAYARRHANSHRFAFGTGKVSALGGFTSAVVLALVALAMGIESITRLLQPETIRFDEAIAVALVGLLVNLVSAWLLQSAGHHHHHGPMAEPEHGHDHGHEHHHAEPHHQHHQDHNLRAAYLHVLADALTSLLAIFALVAGKWLGWIWMDALMGLVGATLITRWGLGLMRDTSTVLLDATPAPATLDRIRQLIERDADNRLADLHVWRLGERDYAAILSLVTHHPRDPDHYRTLLAELPQLSHVTVEVHRCQDPACPAV
jgi:cation diffusion facilitator family transporter